MKKLGLLAVLLAAVPATTASSDADVGRLAVPAQLAVVSYYRSDAGWAAFWTDWRPDRVAADLDRVAGLNANTVRAIVQPAAFGYPEPTAAAAASLQEFVSLAAQRGLHVQLTLFDRWFDWTDIRGSQTWARELLAPYRDDPRIAFIELRNELAPVPEATTWARAMVPFVRRLLQRRTPVTVSVEGPHPVAQLRALKRAGVRPDFYDIHFFGGGGELADEVFARAKEVAAPRPVWVGETGYPTTSAISGYGGVPLTTSAQDEAQAHFLAAAGWAARAEGLPPIGVWVLDDFLASALPDPPATDADPELHFGLFRVDGSPKPAAGVVRAMYSGRVSVGCNGGFERAVSDTRAREVPAQWSMNGAGADFLDDRSVAREGAASARVTSSGVASLSITPPNAGFDGRGRVHVTAWARRAEARGSVFVVVEWFGRHGESLRRRASVPLSGPPLGWERLSVSSRVPSRAAYARIELVADRVGAAVWFDEVSFRRMPQSRP